MQTLTAHVANIGGRAAGCYAALSLKKRGIKLVLIENFFDDAVRAKIEKEIPGVKVLKVPVYVGGEGDI